MQASAAPDRVALVFDDEHCTYADLDRLVAPGVDGTGRGRYLLGCQGVVRSVCREACVPPGGEALKARRPRLLTCVRLLVAHSLWKEPSGVVNLEGLGCRTPVVASRAGGTRDPVAAGRTGPLLSSNDPPALAAAIERASADLELQDSTAGSGPRVVTACHTWRSMDEHHLPRCDRFLGPHETSIE